MSQYTVDALSRAAMNGSVQGYEDTYRVIDAGEAASLRSSREADFRAERSPFYIREQTVSTSRKAMKQRLGDFDARFAAAGNN